MKYADDGSINQMDSKIGNVSIRRAEFQDSLALLELDGLSRSHPWNELQWQSEISEKSAEVWIFEEKARIIASICGRIHDDEAELYLILVSPVVQRKGYGRSVLSYWLSHLRLNSISNVFLEVSSSNVGAIVLYHQLDFIEIGLRKNYYPDGSHALMMERKCEL